MPPAPTAAHAATNPHAPPSGHVARQLANQAVRAIRDWRIADAADTTTDVYYDRLCALEYEVAFHPAGNKEGADFMLAALAGAINRMEEGPEARHMERLVAKLAAFHIGRGSPYAGFYFV